MNMRSLQSVQTRPLDAVTSSRYRLLVELGHGGMADVFLAVQLGSAGFRRLTVLKRLRSALSHDEEFLEMFQQEARLAARLSHPNVVHTHEVGQDEECHFMALEYLQGQSYQAVLKRAGREHYDFAYSVRVLIEALKGLEYAHNLQDFDGTPLHVVHRDISPSNIFLTYDGQIKILDFGIAKAMSSSVETKVGMLKGKISYMSPEQASGEPVNAQSDLYAVGVLLWEAAAGRRRWRGVSEVSVLRKMMAREAPELPDTVGRNLPSLVDEICLRALAPLAADRFETAAQFREALEHLLAVMGRRVSAEEIGRALAEAFAEDRQQLQRSIEGELAKLQRDEDLTMSSLVQARGGTTSGSDRPSAGRMPAPAHGETARTETQVAVPHPRRSVSAGLILGITGVLIAALALAFTVPRYLELSSGAQAAAPSASAKHSPAPAARTVVVHLSAFPPQAKLSLNGEPLSSNPYVAELPMSNGAMTVQAQAVGYATQSSVVALDSDRTVQLELAQLPSEAIANPGVAPAVARASGISGRALAPTASITGAPASAAPISATSPSVDSPPAGGPARKHAKSSVVLDTDNPWQK